jgi:hypothetical protein
MNKKKRLKAAADLFGCSPSEFMSHRLLDDGGVVIIAPTGQKFRYSAEQLAKAKAEPEPEEQEESESVEYAEETHSLEQLKEACREAGLKVSGNKAELVERLNE